MIGGILGGLTMFVWLFVAHEFLPLGQIGVEEIPNEASVLGAMQSAIPQAGLYFFPGLGLGPNRTFQQRNAAMPAYMRKYEQSPHGLLLYHPASGPLHFGAALARQGALSLLEGLLAAWLLSSAAAGKRYDARAGFVVILDALAAVSTSVEYWNWYQFPGNYTAGYIVTQIIGFTLLGLVAAAFVKTDPGAGPGYGKEASA